MAFFVSDTLKGLVSEEDLFKQKIADQKKLFDI